MIGADGGRHPVKESSASRGGDLAGIRAGRGDRVPADRWQSLAKQQAETRDVRLMEQGTPLDNGDLEMEVRDGPV